ncbi:MAG: diguanylate cyclase [Chloroflexi bacterium]|nr:diguanylate cyclase [Chloroflexota bacterium]
MDRISDSWRLNTKWSLAYSTLILLVSGIMALGLYWQLRAAQRQALRERLHDIVSFAAPLVDGDFHSLIRSPEDETKQFYRVVSLRLQSIQETSEVIERIYTLRQKEDGRITYVVDVDPVTPANVGQDYLRASPLLEKGLVSIPGPVIEDSLYTDSSGTHLSGYAPIYDQFRDLDGVLGIDIDATAVIASEAQARQTALVAFLATVPLSLLLGWWLVRHLTSPLNDLMSGVERITQGQLDEAVPLRSRDELGVLANAFNQMTTQLRQTLGGLGKEMADHQRAEKVQRVIYRISQAAISTDSLAELYHSIHTILGELISVENFYIALYDPASDLINFPYFMDQYDEQPPAVKPGRGLTGYILRTGYPLLVTPEVFDELVQQGEIELAGTKPVDWLGTPLKIDEQAIGVMVVQSYSKEIRFNQENLDLFEFVSTQVALAIERKRAVEALKIRNHELTILHETATAINTSISLEAVLDIVAEQMTRALDLGACTLSLWKREKNVVETLVDYSARIPEKIEPPGTTFDLTDYPATRRVLETGEPILIHRDDPMSDRAERVFLGQWQVYTLLMLPMVVDDRVIGLVELMDEVKKRDFLPEEIRLADSLSTQAAVAIDKARLYKQAQQEIAERKRAEEALHESNERYRALFEDSPISLWEEDFSGVKQILESLRHEGVTDFQSYLASHPEVVAECAAQVKILDVNKATLVLFGAKTKEDMLINLASIFCDESYVAFQDELVRIAVGQTEFNWEGINQTMDGKRIDISISWSVVPGYERDLSKVIISMIDITHQKQAEKKLVYLSTHDALTGLYNRAFFDEEMARLERGRKFPISIVMADLDDLKVTNDREGHATGDELLRQTAKALLASFRAEDVIARIGGDEFAVLLPDIDTAAAKKAIQRIKDNIQIQNATRPGSPLSLSLGASTAEEGGSLADALKQADTNMYRDKQRKS